MGGMIEQVTDQAAGVVDNAEQSAMSSMGNGSKLLSGFAGSSGSQSGQAGNAGTAGDGKGQEKGADKGSQGSGGKSQGGGDFLSLLKSGVHTRLMTFGLMNIRKLGAKVIAAGAAKVTGVIKKMLTPKVKFKLGAEEHELWVEKGKNRNVVMMASKNPAPIKVKIQEGEMPNNGEANNKCEKIESEKDDQKVVQQNEVLADTIQAVTAGVGGVDDEDEKTAIDEFIAGERSFDGAVLDEYVEVYASKINENDTNWSWNKSIPGGDKLSAKQRSAIREKAIEVKAIPSVEVKKVKGLKYGYADFKGAGVVKIRYVLPQELWKADDKTQFDWLNNKLKSEHSELYPEGCTELQPPKYTWHHSEGKGIDGMGGDDDGVMYLISYGVHHAYTHNGGRTKGHWADAPRTKKGKKRGKKRK